MAILDLVRSAAADPPSSQIFAAFLISFFAKGLSATNRFCYESLASAGIVMILPGCTLNGRLYASLPNWTDPHLARTHTDIILQGCLEVASRSIVSGAIRLVYGGILSLFLGVGISLGSTLYVGQSALPLKSAPPRRSEERTTLCRNGPVVERQSLVRLPIGHLQQLGSDSVQSDQQRHLHSPYPVAPWLTPPLR